jgi:hypothetical protein
MPSGGSHASSAARSTSAAYTASGGAAITWPPRSVLPTADVLSGLLQNGKEGLGDVPGGVEVGQSGEPDEGALSASHS